MATIDYATLFYVCFGQLCFSNCATSKFKLWDGLEPRSAIKLLIHTRVCKLSSLTSVSCWWKWRDVFYCGYLTAWLCAYIDTCLAATHRSSALIHLLRHASAIFAGPCPGKMWLHFLSNSVTVILFVGLLVSFSSEFTFRVLMSNSSGLQTHSIMN